MVEPSALCLYLTMLCESVCDSFDDKIVRTEQRINVIMDHDAKRSTLWFFGNLDIGSLSLLICFSFCSICNTIKMGARYVPLPYN